MSRVLMLNVACCTCSPRIKGRSLQTERSVTLKLALIGEDCGEEQEMEQCYIFKKRQTAEIHDLIATNIHLK